MLPNRIEISEWRAVYPGRIKGGVGEGERVISLTTVDERKGCLGAFVRFLCLCVCLGIRRDEG